MYVITGRYHFRGRAVWAASAVLACLGPGGCEIERGRGQDEQIADDGADAADPGFHWCWSDHWQVVRGGRSVLTLTSVEPPGAPGLCAAVRCATAMLEARKEGSLPFEESTLGARTPHATRRGYGRDNRTG
jgi:hypothetical protein